MPHVEMGLGPQTGTTSAFQTARQLIPGIEPGGSRAGEPMKAALLLQNAWVEPVDIALNTDGATGTDSVTWILKLSQEQSMNPGLILPVAWWGGETQEASAVARFGVMTNFVRVFRARNTLWAPKWIAVGVIVRGSISVDSNFHLDYEKVDVPFWDWFMLWDFLDNVTDNTRDY